MTMLRWDPKIMDLSPGLAALSDAVDVTNAAKQRRREAERQRLRDEAADKYNQGQLDHLSQMDARSAEEANDRKRKDTEEATTKVVQFLNKGPAGLAEAKALASGRGWNVESGTRAEMPKLQLDEPSFGAASPEQNQSPLGLAGMLRGPNKPERYVDQSSIEPPKFEQDDQQMEPRPAPRGIAGLFGKGLNVDPSVTAEPKLGQFRQGVDQYSEDVKDPLKRGQYHFQGGGTDVMVDPDAGRARDMEQLDSTFSEASKTDPVIAKYWPQIRATVAGSRDPMSSEKILDYIRIRATADAQSEQAAADKKDARAYDWQKFGLGEQGKDRRAAMAERGAATRAGEKSPTEGQSTAASRATVMLPESQRIEGSPPLSPEGRQALFEELAYKNAAEKNPTADLVARLAGARQAIQARLKGSDKQVYAAYMAWADPLVRQRTGANAPPGEVANLLDPIIPAIGDRPEDLVDKKKRRGDYLRSFAVQTKNPAEWNQKIDSLYGPPGGKQPHTGQPPSNVGALKQRLRQRLGGP